MTKVTDIPDKIIALVIQVLFGVRSCMACPKSTPLSFMDAKKLLLFINELLDIRNMNIRYILSRNILLKKLVNNVMIFSKFTSHNSFNKLIEQYIYFVKHFHGYFLSNKEKRIDMSESCRYELVLKKEYIKFLFKSLSCIENQKHEYKFLLHGPHNQVEIFSWMDKEWLIRYLIDGLTVVSETNLGEYMKVRKVIATQIINNFLTKNLHKNEMERQQILTPAFCVLLLKTIMSVHCRYYNYESCYHTAIVNLK